MVGPRGPSPRLSDSTLSESPFLVVGVVVLLAGAAALLWTRLAPQDHPRDSVNETAAIASLRNLAACQSQAAASKAIDLDGDGIGEFGFYEELTAAAPLRAAPDGSTRASILDPPILSPACSPRAGRPLVTKAGFCYRIYLPSGPTGAATEIAPGAPFSAPVDTDLAERHWCAYAWPVAEETGRRAFYVDESGNIWQCGNGDRRFLGPDRAPAWDAALPAGAPRAWTTRRTAGGPGNDGEVWTKVE